MKDRRWWVVAAVAALTLSGNLASANAPDAAPVDAPKVATDAPKTKEERDARLESTQSEIQKLNAQSRDITARMMELVLKMKDMQPEEADAEMRKLLDELKGVNDRLDKLEEDVADLKGWKEGMDESLPVLLGDVFDLKRSRVTNYMQFQYRDSNELGSGRQHAFAFRRIRVGSQLAIDSKTSIRLSFDLATGGDNTAAQLRDAILVYDVIPSDVQVGLQVAAGQQALPLGYELERSSGDREFPERATYNRRLFDGERNRGITARYGLNPSTTVFAGFGSSLTYNDPEQRGIASMPLGRTSYYAGIKHVGPQFEFGLSAFNGKRPKATINSDSSGAGPITRTVFSYPEVTRSFIYADAQLVGIPVPQMFLRGEYMRGNDRVTSPRPANGAGASKVEGWHTVLGYNLSPRNVIFGRIAEYDPNRSVKGNTIREYGLGYRYFINPGASLTFSYEWFRDPGATKRNYNVATLRYQFRF